MVLIQIDSNNLLNGNPIQPTFIDNNQPPYNYIYGKAVFPLSTYSGSHKKLILKSFQAGLRMLDLEKYYNNHLTYENITDNTVTRYDFTPQSFATAADMITYLNATCTDLNFVYNNLPSSGDKFQRVTINHVDPTKAWRLIFDTTSIGRSLGFDLGHTVIAQPGQTITGLFPFTTSSIGKFYLSLNIGSDMITNLRTPATFVIDLISNYNREGVIDDHSIYFTEGKDFQQSVNIQSTQFNQIVLGIFDSFGNIVNLRSHYSLTLELV